MNINDIKQNIPSELRSRWEYAVSQNNISQAVALLTGIERVEEAIEFCRIIQEPDRAIEVAIEQKMFDKAEKLCVEYKKQEKLIDVLILKGDQQKAANLLAQSQQYEKAAKIYFNCNQFDKAGEQYEKIHQYLNAVMCYQKAGNTMKQTEAQLKAFEYDYNIADGDLSAINVSRTMAIYAARAYLSIPQKVERALDILKKANALEESASNLAQIDAFVPAALCYEAAGKFEEAIHAYFQAAEYDAARALCLKIKKPELEPEFYKQTQNSYQLGCYYERIGNVDAAIEVLQKIEADDPNSIAALEKLGDLLHDTQKLAASISCFEAILLNNSDNNDTLVCRIAYKAARCADEFGDLKKAQSFFRLVYNINPNYEDVKAKVSSISQQLNEVSHTSTPRVATRTRRKTISDMMINQVPATVNIGPTAVPVGNNRYNIIEEIARGGMGIVYKATDTILMRTVVLKVLSQNLKENEVALEYFMREARASAQLQHPNIVTVYDIGALSDGNIYMAMEYVNGKTLKQIIQQAGILPTKLIVQLMMHACRGLQFAHDNGIIHRDVKSSNMMIAKRDKVLKILDLGLAKVVTDNIQESTQAIGTPYYMSPEQVLGHEIDARSDIYSLGVTIFELATGTLPFTKGDLPYKHVHEPPPLPSSVNAKINPQLEDMILKMMQKCPDDRFSSCIDVMNALKQIDVSI